MGELFALYSALGFALCNAMIKKGTAATSNYNGAFLSNLITLAIAGLAEMAFILQNGGILLQGQGILWFILAGLFTSFFGRTYLFSSIQLLGSVRAAILSRLNPFMAVLIGLLLLGEPFDKGILFGGMFILAAFVLTSVHTLRANRVSIVKIRTIGIVYGVIAGLSYAVGHLFRKMGLLELPDPFLAAVLGSLVGSLVVLLLAMFRGGSNAVILRSTFTEFRPWIFAAGVFQATAQIAYFIALNYAPLSRVALINSTDLLLNIVLSAWIIRTQEIMNPPIILASMLAVVGTLLIFIT